MLFCRTFGWNMVGKSSAGFDATDDQGNRYQIKARRLTPHNRSRQLSAIRKLESDPFDYLAGVLFDEAFVVIRAAIIPLKLVRACCKYVEHTHSWRFLLRDEIWEMPDLRDVTLELRAAGPTSYQRDANRTEQAPRLKIPKVESHRGRTMGQRVSVTQCSLVQ